MICFVLICVAFPSKITHLRPNRALNELETAHNHLHRSLSCWNLGVCFVPFDGRTIFNMQKGIPFSKISDNVCRVHSTCLCPVRVDFKKDFKRPLRCIEIFVLVPLRPPGVNKLMRRYERSAGNKPVAHEGHMFAVGRPGRKLLHQTSVRNDDAGNPSLLKSVPCAVSLHA